MIWINAKDRLPEKDRQVLIWYECGTESRHLLGRVRFNQLLTPDGWNGDFSDRVTHWAELPERPVSDGGTGR